VEIGLVEARGERKGRTYHLSAATYRRLGLPSAYVRRRGFEPIQQEQMVLQYVRAHGRVTRREAAELCQISLDQAYRLLQGMVKKGVLIQHGKKMVFATRLNNRTPFQHNRMRLYNRGRA
jgi:ATP-dependent DNA helicase RecG